jgi:hypothetical protein
MSIASMSDPFLSSSSSTFACPSCAATCVGVLSTFVLASFEMPALSNVAHVSACPYCEERWRGDVPSQSVVKGAPLLMRDLTSSESPSRAADRRRLPSSTREYYKWN